MLRPTLKAMKSVVMPAVFVVAALIGFQGTDVAAQGQGLWSIVAHFRYENGFEFDYVIQRGVPASGLGAALGECGATHWIGSVVRYYCYPVAE